MKLCDWADFDRESGDLLQRISRGEKASNPFPVLSVASSLVLQRKAA